MNLRELAEADLAITLEDGVSGFGWPVTVTDPSGAALAMTAQSNDVAQVIDPDTGQAVSGRSASATLRISSLTAGGLGLPVGVADTTTKPWLVQFDDINGNPHLFKVVDGDPDRALGVVVCHLEAYE